MKKITFSKEQLEWIINEYTNNHLSMQKIGEKLGVSKSVISRVLKENNIQINNDNHKYKADYDKFKVIDTPEKAYWLGFIAADGCLYVRPDAKKAGAFLYINIHSKDKEHLEKFKKFMNSNVEIKDTIQNQGFSNNTPMSKIIFNSNVLVNDCINKGVTPNKSLTLKPPIIPEEFYLPFILGYFDGDGSIFYLEDEKIYGINIVGTKELLEWINNLLNISNHLEQRTKTEKNTYYIRCGGTNKPYQIMKKLYNSTNIHLDRKYKMYKQLETVVSSRNTR